MRNLFFLISYIFPFFIYAHNAGTITGRVSDVKDGAPIIGAIIQIKGTLIRTVSDISGIYEIKNIQIGNYELICSQIGYKTMNVSIIVKENVTDTIHFKMLESVIDLNELTIETTNSFSAASSKEIRAIDMQLKPIRSSQDMLLMVPGLFIAQHQGGGKAEQIFLRGFDCDHGTDVSVNVDEMPVNMPTHAHGQGYADLHFLIAETVDEMEVNKGPYLAKYGDFYTAGAVSFKTKDVLDHNLFKLEAGQFNTQKYTLLLQPNKGGKEQNGYLAAQYFHTDGPYKTQEGFQRMNVFGKYFFQLTHNSKLTFSFSGFNTGWNASGQIPERAVKQGLISRFGALDHNEGGNTNRENINLSYNFLSTEGNEFEVHAFMSNYNFKLFSNFTYLLFDSIHGDMIEQTEHRTISGLNATYKLSANLFGLKSFNKISCGYRGDDIAVQLWHSPNRVRMNVFTNDDVDIRNLFAWAEQKYILSRKFKIVWGLRHDYFTFSKNDNVSNALDTTNNGLPHTSGTASKSVFSPKINFIFSPNRKIEVYLNFGQGFHSNDARDIIIGQTISNLTSNWKQDGLNENQINTKLQQYNFDSGMNGVSTLPKATAGELGLQTKLFKKLHVNLAVWYLYLEKEYVYAGDGGTTELSNPTQRLGIDAEFRYPFLSWLWFDADVSYANATIKNLSKGHNHVPLAPVVVASGGLSVLPKKGFSGAFRFRHVGNRPGDEDYTLTAPGYTIFNANISYQLKKILFSFYCENIFNINWNEAQFETLTKLKGENQPVNDICFTPGNPRNFQFGISYKF